MQKPYEIIQAIEMKIPSPEHVFNSVVTTPFAEEAIKVIANKLNDPHYVNNNLSGKPENPYILVIIKGVAGQGDKHRIISELLDAGWGNVIVNNSGDLVEIEIYRNKQPKPIEVDAPSLVTVLNM